MPSRKKVQRVYFIIFELNFELVHVEYELSGKLVIRLDVNETIVYFFLLFGTGLPTVLKIIMETYFNYHETAVPLLPSFTGL